jgi:serine protease Do
MKTDIKVLLAALALFTPFMARAQPSAAVPAPTPVTLVKVFVDMPPGTPFMAAKSGPFCGNERVVTYNGGREEQRIETFRTPFVTELTKAGYQADLPGGSDIFNPEATVSDLQLAAVIVAQRLNICIPNVYRTSAAKGDGTMTVDWQLYSRLRQQVLARIRTTATYTMKDSVDGGPALLLAGSFGANVKLLTADPEFRKALTQATPGAGTVIDAGGQPRIALPGNSKAPARPLSEAVGDVVVVSTGFGSGSGVLVSDDGYVLTNAHVVGKAKTVKLRWSDGLETVGEVVRVADGRDVALVKTDARGRSPLALKRGAVVQGQQVYAIGSPMGQKFQGSVTRGVVSANRVIDGLSYIQSDVAVAPGSSGGPLLDETGHVIGLAVGGVTIQATPMGLNMFIPASDAMDFLALDAR